MIIDVDNESQYRAHLKHAAYVHALQTFQHGCSSCSMVHVWHGRHANPLLSGGTEMRREQHCGCCCCCWSLSGNGSDICWCVTACAHPMSIINRHYFSVGHTRRKCSGVNIEYTSVGAVLVVMRRQRVPCRRAQLSPRHKRHLVSLIKIKSCRQYLHHASALTERLDSVSSMEALCSW